jgi:hypothetical protein
VGCIAGKVAVNVIGICETGPVPDIFYGFTKGSIGVLPDKKGGFFITEKQLICI